MVTKFKQYVMAQEDQFSATGTNLHFRIQDQIFPQATTI